MLKTEKTIIRERKLALVLQTVALKGTVTLFMGKLAEVGIEPTAAEFL